MKRTLALLVLHIAIASSFAAEGIPEAVSADSYTITTRLPEGMWAVEVFAKAEIIRYSHAAEPNSRSPVFRISTSAAGMDS